MIQTYNDISPAVQGYADSKLLTRQKTNNILGQFGQSRTLPSRSTKNIFFTRWNRLSPATTPLTEGVTPTGKTNTKTTITATLQQFGDYVTITDVIQDTHTDPVLNENIDILGEQAADTYDILRAGELKSGTNVVYANGTSRSAVNTAISSTILSAVKRTLKRQEAKYLKDIIKAGPNIGTSPIAPCFVVVCHTDIEKDLEAISGYKPVEQYASTAGLIEGEVGAFGNFRFVIDNNLTPWTDAGGAKGSMISTTGTSADVYPMLVFGKDAYGIVQLAGKNNIQTYVNNPKPSDSDPLAQRGTVGWKGYHACKILNDLWMCRIEVAATA